MHRYQALKGVLFLFVFVSASQVGVEAARADLSCAMCQWALAEVDKYITTKPTEDEIGTALAKVCSYLPGVLQPECRSMVEEVSPTLISLIRDKVPDIMICQSVSLCPYKMLVTPCASLTPVLSKAPPYVDPQAETSPASVRAADPPSFQKRVFLILEKPADKALLAIETSDSSVRVPEGVLRYRKQYWVSVLDVSTTDEIMDVVDFVFDTPVRPGDEDDYGAPLIAQGLRDSQGNSIPLADAKLSTLLTAGAGLLRQQEVLAAVQQSGGVMKDAQGAPLATMNLNDVAVVRSDGGRGAEVIMAAANTDEVATVRPLTASGYVMDKSGSLQPAVSLAPSGISFPLGLFDFTVSIAANATGTTAVIVPPAPLDPHAKWYKVGPDGTLREYPHFVVDGQGNGILTLHDNDEWDQNPAHGLIGDRGGPGVIGEGKSGCFIATAAYGSPLHPCVKTLRDFRDTVLLASSPGRSVVRWYNRVSPPIAGVIARHTPLIAVVRLALLPAIGFAWFCLKIGFAAAAGMLLVLCILVAVVIRSCISAQWRCVGSFWGP